MNQDQDAAPRPDVGNNMEFPGISFRKLGKSIRSILVDMINDAFDTVPAGMRKDINALEWLRHYLVQIPGRNTHMAGKTTPDIDSAIGDSAHLLSSWRAVGLGILDAEVPFYYRAMQAIGRQWSSAEQRIHELDIALRPDNIQASVRLARRELSTRTAESESIDPLSHLLMNTSGESLASAYEEILGAHRKHYVGQLNQARRWWRQWLREVKSLESLLDFVGQFEFAASESATWNAKAAQVVAQGLQALANVETQPRLCDTMPREIASILDKSTAVAISRPWATTDEVRHIMRQIVKMLLRRSNIRLISVVVNGVRHDLSVKPRLLLVDLLREVLDLTGTHIGCDTGQCGACTVMLNGQPVKSCMVLAVQADGSELTTVEGLAEGGKYHPIQEAFWEKHGLQCGFCTPGMMIAAVGIIKRNPNPTDEEIREQLEGNLCRCTGYQNIIEAVQSAAAMMRASAARGLSGQAVVKAGVKSGQSALHTEQQIEAWEVRSMRLLREVFGDSDVNGDDGEG